MAPLPEPPAESPLAGAETPVLRFGTDAAFDVLRLRGLMVPVAGVRPASLSDSYDAPRDGGRRHEAIDILAPRGTPVLAADDGVIVRIGTNVLGGKVVWTTDTGQLFAYYYAHLDRHARGLREGQAVKRGAVLGYVGTTGNAPPDTPHLHFQMMRMLDARRFSGGTPLNPLPYFQAPGLAAGAAP
jgi:murein DD-endopeptidase MepM/ murein hydrolase activator NlpD